MTLPDLADPSDDDSVYCISTIAPSAADLADVPPETVCLVVQEEDDALLPAGSVRGSST